ncbi:gypsy retrotransposon integrase-like protein 1 [Plakobranchus ocellatus]|uniref:Gypsy retrotransposon integrase-like protein 1 n=1 Tax=Plakobranchus ocellatus TaxID=259542 RepID=A0AAV4C7M7_9GAST|nr:gypsy retrotransposon integrase-like protein 1 [Plakobranchus ocellatus]
MSVAHDSITGAHLGIRRTKDKVLSNFYWPEVNGDVTRYCRSCDVCQRTVKKGTVPRVPLEKVPLIDTPFKRVAIDLVGPINLPSEAGHRFILTLVDYATRFAEAVPLRKIDTQSVAEALVDIYSRLGVPEEVLSYQRTQFISDCMKEVCRLLGIKQKTTTPYHPMCNGLVERFNATLKTCLRRLCSEQPRQWHRYINPLLFAYREMPQESTHFAPFELLYGRTVRGSMHILRELWTKEIEEPDVKSSYEYVLNLLERLDDTLKIAREELENAHGRQKCYYDRTAKRRKFSVGEKVLVLLPTDSNKLLMQWK